MRCGSATLSRTPSGTLGAGNTIMGRHRQTGPPRAQQAALLATSAATSHRRAQSSPRVRAATVLAVGVLAAGAVITATTVPWLQDAALPRSRAGEPARPPDSPAAPPAPPTAPAAPTAPTAALPAPGAPSSGAAAPTQPATSPGAPSIPTAPAVTLWRAGDSGAFRSTSWNRVGAPAPRVEGSLASVWLTGRGQRSELEPDLPAVREGDQHDVTFALCLGRDFPAHGSGRQVIARWENDGPGPAPLDLRVRDGHLVLHGGEGHPSGWRVLDQSLGPVPTGQWVEVGLRVRFAADPERAHVSAWRDGEPVLVEHHPPGGTLYPGQQSHLKVGLHRDAAIAHPTAVHFRDLRVSRTSTATRPERRAVPSTSRHRTETATSSHATSLAQRHSAGSASPRGTSHGSVARNTPMHVTTSHAAPKHESSGRDASAGAGRAATHAHP